MEFRILGPLEVVENGSSLALGGVRQRALLAVLLLHANEAVSTDRLMERLWGDDPPPTAAKTLQVYVSRLRKLLGEGRIVTRPPGYELRVSPGELDLERFESTVAAARAADPLRTSELLASALALWRGQPLADLVYEPFAQAEISRLEEIRLAVLADRIDAELELGRHADVIAELEALVFENPLHERSRAQLMLALYRSGRQAEALETFQQARRILAGELGLEPSEALKRLEQAILRHDPSLEATADLPRVATARVPERSILVVPQAPESLDPLLGLAELLARSEPPREIVVVQVVEPAELGSASALLASRRDELLAAGVFARAAAFSSPDPADDLVRLSVQHEVDLLLLDIGREPLAGVAAVVLDKAPCDVGLLVGVGGARRRGPVIVPFGAAEHDWAALELGAWVARATGDPVWLVGMASDGRLKGRDASRLLADASLILQRTAGVAAEPLLAVPGRETMTALAEGAGLFVVGLSERWRQEGLGAFRAEIASSPPAPTVFVRRGERPGGLAPAESRSRFTWSLKSSLGG